MSDTPALTKLVVDLSTVSPEDAFSSVPYIKGQTFLRYLEDLLGGPKSFEPFLKFYLNKYKYQSIETDDFKATLYNYFVDKYDTELGQIDWDKWLYGEGMPPIIPNYNTALADIAHRHSDLWSTESLENIKRSDVLYEILSSNQKIEFLETLVLKDNITALSDEWIKLIESTYNLGVTTKNCEIRFRFVRLCIKARLTHRLGEIIEFANSNFRMKYVRPVYRDLGQWETAKPIALENFSKVRNQMMNVCATQVAKDLGLPK